jgi:hypothetical protein
MTPDKEALMRLGRKLSRANEALDWIVSNALNKYGLIDLANAPLEVQRAVDKSIERIRNPEVAHDEAIQPDSPAYG